MRRVSLMLLMAAAAMGLMVNAVVAQEEPDQDIEQDGLALWLDASSYDPESGTWTDASGNGHDAHQDDADSRPALVEDELGGGPVVRFDGQDLLQSEPFDEPLGQPNTVFIVGRMNDLREGSFSYLIDGHSDGRHALYGLPSGRWSLWAGARGETDFETDTDWNLFAGLYNESRSQMWVNSVASDIVAVGDDSLTGFSAGAHYSGGDGFDGDIAEVLIYDRALDEDERAAVETALQDKHGLEPDPEPEPPMVGAGTEDRDWVSGVAQDPTSPERHEVEVTDPISIEMRDGVTLDGKMHLPEFAAEGEGAAPCVLAANGYPRSHGAFPEADARLADLAERGFAAVHVTYRGISNSEGEAGLYNEYGRDGHDVVQWMAEQDWCDGNVGMIGSSLIGINQWLVAKEAPPNLKAIVPDVACGNCYEYLWYPGGMLPGPGRENRGPDEYGNAILHRNYDEWWRDRTTIAEDHEAMADNDIAIMATGGWQDYISAGNVQAFEEFAAADGEGTLIMHPGAHSGPRDSFNGPYHYDEHVELFFDHYLRGEDNEVSEQDDALLYINGAERWRWEETWPIPDARQAQLRLREAEAGSIDSLNDGSLTAAAPDDDEASVSYSYDPDDGPFLPTRRSGGSGITDEDMQPWESEVLTWTTDELDEPTEVTGKYALEFFAEADAADTDFVLMVSDVAPDGTSRQVTSGYLNAPRNESRSEPDPLEPGEVRQYQMDTQAMSWVFDEGHRIRFSLAGGTEGAPDVGSGQGPAQNETPAEVTIYQDAERPATVQMPVIGSALLPTEDAEEPDVTSKDECKDGGWEDFGFRNQGQCIRYVNTGQDSR